MAVDINVHILFWEPPFIFWPRAFFSGTDLTSPTWVINFGHPYIFPPSRKTSNISQICFIGKRGPTIALLFLAKFCKDYWLIGKLPACLQKGSPISAHFFALDVLPGYLG